MAETTTQKQQRIAAELQQIMTEQVPALDFSVGTVLYELLVKPASVFFAAQETEMDVLRANMSLVQVLNQVNPDPTAVDNLLSNFNYSRKQGTQATGLINIYVKTTQNVYIAATTDFTCNGVTIRPVKSYVGVAGQITEEDTDEVGYVQMRDVDATTKVFAITATTVNASATVIAAGTTCSATLNDPAIVKIEIGSTFTGGSLEETTSQLLERASTSINAKVVSGRDNIRSLLRSQPEVNVLDAFVVGMGDPLQIRDVVNPGGISTGGHVDTYVVTAPVPIQTRATLSGNRVSGDTWDIEIPADTFPGAYAVLAVWYGNTQINTGLTPVLGYEPVGPYPLITSAEQARYSKYQTLHVRFETDLIPVATLIANFEVVVLHMPGIGALQDYVNGDDVRSYSFDHVIKVVIPVIIDADVNIEYVRGISPPDVGVIQQSISNVINTKALGTEALFVSDIVYAVRLVFTNSVVRMPVNLRARVYLPDGSTAYAANQNHIKVEEGPGISYRNCAFFCYASEINIQLKETPL